VAARSVVNNSTSSAKALWTEYKARKGDSRWKGNGNGVAATRDSKLTVVERVKCDPAFAKALLDEAVTLFLNGEPETARLVLRDLVNGTMGFERLATLTGKPAKSLHRMLSTSGNPGMDNLSMVLRALGKRLRVRLSGRTVKAA